MYNQQAKQFLNKAEQLFFLIFFQLFCPTTLYLVYASLLYNNNDDDDDDNDDDNDDNDDNDDDDNNDDDNDAAAGDDNDDDDDDDNDDDDDGGFVDQSEPCNTLNLLEFTNNSLSNSLWFKLRTMVLPWNNFTGFSVSPQEYAKVHKAYADLSSQPLSIR